MAPIAHPRIALALLLVAAGAPAATQPVETPPAEPAGSPTPTPDVAVELPPLEALPPHLSEATSITDDAFADGAPPGARQTVIKRLALWNLAQGPILVCFMDGTTAIKTRIAKVAREWELPGSSIKFDFGPGPIPQLCRRGTTYHIRIGFRYKGFWSLVGQHSIHSAQQYEQSMNFESWHNGQVDETTLRRYVLHEFGHALGLHHEHQSPRSVCATEFDWEVARAELAKKPNEWSEAQVDENLKQLYDEDIVASAFDPESIMIYALPAQFFKNGKASPCFHAENDALSKTDRLEVAAAYPSDPQAVAQLRAADYELARTLLGSSTNSIAQRRLGITALSRFSPKLTIDAKSKLAPLSQQLLMERQIDR